MPLIEAVASRETACVSTAPVFEESDAPSVGGGWWLFAPRKEGEEWVHWWGWVGAVVASASVGDSVAYFPRFVVYSLCLLANAWLPSSKDTVAPYYAIVLSLPLLLARSLESSPSSLVVFLFGVVPLVDVVTGADATNHSKGVQKEREASLKYRVAPCVGAACVVVNCFYVASRVDGLSSSSSSRWPWWKALVGAGLSCGVYTGSVGITVAHELSHRASSVERFFGRAALAVTGYGHFAIEHTLGHHKRVGLECDPATARFGESFWRFLPRCVLGEARSAWALAKDDTAASVASDLVLPYVCSLLSVVGLALFAGPWTSVVPFYLVQALTAVLLFESVNYLEHYGLERHTIHDVVDPSHSWDSPNRFTNHVLFNLQRHSDHHAHAGKRYQSLQLSNDAPTLPAGYATMVLLAFFPPLWRRVVHPRLLRHRTKLLQQNPNKRFRHGPSSNSQASSNNHTATPTTTTTTKKRD
mmetsp:Transcript_30682/g.98886  ORF Transcript_30682/g.98886 Transcript_30682/m.98886 type:complete len:471 (+) Transcript_30682:88-1500(+)